MLFDVLGVARFGAALAVLFLTGLVSSFLTGFLATFLTTLVAAFFATGLVAFAFPAVFFAFFAEAVDGFFDVDFTVVLFLATGFFVVAMTSLL